MWSGLRLGMERLSLILIRKLILLWSSLSRRVQKLRLNLIEIIVILNLIVIHLKSLLLTLLNLL